MPSTCFLQFSVSLQFYNHSITASMPRGAFATATHDEAPLKREGLKLAQIASYDDLLTDALVDRVYFWTRIRKNRSRYSASRNIREEDVTNILRQSIVVEKDATRACTQLLDLPGLKRPYNKLSKDDQGHFQRHLRKYVDMYLPDCPFEVSTTNRYTIDTHEAATTARKPIRKGELIKYLVGIQVPITSEDEKSYDISRQDFSIVMSSRKRTQSLFLGPARFANHDCDANAKLTTKGPHSMTVIAARDIGIGEEITVSYGGDYFGIDNCECLCATCESFGRNGWDPTLTQDSSEDEEAVGEERASRSKDLQRSRSRRMQRDPVKSHLPDHLLKRMQSCEDAKCKISKHRKIARVHRSLIKHAKDSILQLRASRTSMIDQGFKSATPEPRQSESGVLVDLEEEGKELETDLSELTSKLAEIETELASIKARATASEDSGPPRTPQRVSNSAELSTGPTPRSLPQHPRLEKLRNIPLQNAPLRLRQSIQSREDFSNAIETPRTKSRGGSTSSSPSADRSHHNSRLSTPATSLSDVVMPYIEEPRQRRSASLLSVPNVTPEDQNSATTRRTRSSLVRSAHIFPSSSTKPVTDSEIEDTGDPTLRRPGDYTLTTRLLGTPYSRWVECRVCDEYYVQTDSYHLRWSCPRCERHSKLYGYQWPKTDKLGKHDTEERVLDHRTVNRFVAPEEVKSIKRGRRTVPIILDNESQELQSDHTESAECKGGKQISADNSLRGQKRRRTDLHGGQDEPIHRPAKRGRLTLAKTLHHRSAARESVSSRLRNDSETKTASRLSKTSPGSQTRVKNRQLNKGIQTRNAKPAAEVQAVRTKRQYVRSGKYARRGKSRLLNIQEPPIPESELQSEEPTTTESSLRRVSLRLHRNTLKLLNADKGKQKGRLPHGCVEDLLETRQNMELVSSRLRPSTPIRVPLVSDKICDTIKVGPGSQDFPEVSTNSVRSGRYVGRYNTKSQTNNRLVPIANGSGIHSAWAHSDGSPLNGTGRRDPFVVPLEDPQKQPGEGEYENFSSLKDVEKSGNLNSGSQPKLTPETGGNILGNSTKLEDGHTSQTKTSLFHDSAGSDTISAPLTRLCVPESEDDDRIAPSTRERHNRNRQSAKDMPQSAKDMPQSAKDMIGIADGRRVESLPAEKWSNRENRRVSLGDEDDGQTLARSTRHRSGGVSVLELLANADRRRLDYIANDSGNDRTISAVAGKLTTPSASKRLKAAINTI